jgi:DNA-binding CsgD family transcriptional regulator
VSHDLFCEALDLQRPIADTGVLCSALSNLAVIEAQMGSVAQSREHTLQARGLYAERTHLVPMLLYTTLAQGFIAFQQEELREAQDLCEQVITNAGYIYVKRNIATAHMILSCLALRSGNSKDGIMHGDSAFALDSSGSCDVFPGIEQIGNLLHLPLLRKASEGSSVAKRWLAAALAFIDDEPYDEAPLLALLDSTDSHYVLALLNTWLLLACKRERNHDIDGATNALMHAIDLAEPDRLLQPFCGAAPYIGESLHEATRRDSRAFVRDVEARVLEHMQHPRSTGSSINPNNVDIRLSAREIDVMRLVAIGLSTKDIADRLFISPDTVKKHLRNVFQKTGAHSRTQAIATMRSLNLL